MISTNQELKEVGGQVGNTYGLEVDCRFSDFKEFKCSWRKLGNNISFEVTDYLRNAPEDAMKGYMAVMIESALKLPKRDYPLALKAHLQSEAFLKQNQPIYIARSRNLTTTGRGNTYNLEAMYCKLITRGMVEDVPNVHMTWTKRPNRIRMGYTSPIMNTVAISSIMDRPEVPEFVPEYVLYHELLHHERQYNRTARSHDSWFKMREAEYPKSEEAERWLKKLAFG